MCYLSQKEANATMHKHSHQLKHAMRIGNGDVTAARRGPGLSDELLVRLEQRRERERETGRDGEAS